MPFQELVPADLPWESYTPQDVIVRLATELKHPSTAVLIDTLRMGAGRVVSQQTLALIANDQQRLTTLAAGDWATIMARWSPAFPSNFRERPHSWAEGTNKFIQATEIALAGAGGGAPKGNPDANAGLEGATC